MYTTQPLPTQSPLIISYLTLRKWVGFLGILLAPLLVLGALLLNPHQQPKILDSISAYYYSKMQDEMEGILCGIAMFLLAYRGYSKQDSIVSKLAGLFALCIAFFPTSATDDKKDPISILHYVTAGIFFALLAYMSIFLFTKSAWHMTKQKVQRNRVYRACGIVLAVAVIGIPIDGIGKIPKEIGFLKPTLVFETIALTSFGISWLTKGEFILKDKPAGA
jgi:hypothetical protein